jgi:hypothetical protein
LHKGLLLAPCRWPGETLLRNRLPRCVFHAASFNGQLVLVARGLSASDTPSPHFDERHSFSTLRVSTVGAAAQTACPERARFPCSTRWMAQARRTTASPYRHRMSLAHINRYRDHSFRRYTLRRDIYAAPLSAVRRTPTAFANSTWQISLDAVKIPCAYY